ncbi:replication protein [Thermoactinomyces sp. CICC 10520]|uniref:replication protein n=1 Tax=Thermoactinomyces sp. CICC 10520 TaxID=2767433 RepID=UPI0018DB2662|nr:replication protein [Thermoactinomyces sp. CICC 10520]MBH8587111.1 replication protein [Thermoactinomyces sp. CICC 10520]
MANPQPDKFIKLSNELYEAIMTADFSKRQRKVLDLIIRMSYGCQKKYALLRPIDFELVGIWKVDIQKELKHLEKSKVIFRDGDRIELNKNYDQWRIGIVKSFDEDKMKALIKRNLEQREVSKTLTEHEDGLVKHLPPSKQNTNQEVSKILTDMPPNSSNDKGFERPKDILKTIKDINDDDIYRPELEETSSEPDERINKIKNHFSKKAQKIWYSSEEDLAMTKLLDEGVPVKTILDGIDLAFERFKPKHSRDRINSFRYCLPAIYELHERGVDHATSKSSSKRGYSENSGYPEISQGYYDQFDIFA